MTKKVRAAALLLAAAVFLSGCGHEADSPTGTISPAERPETEPPESGIVTESTEPTEATEPIAPAEAPETTGTDETSGTADSTAPAETTAKIPDTPGEPIPLPDGVNSNIDNESVSDLIGELKAFTDKYRDISVYYTDTGRKYFLGINESHEHEGASTLKAMYCHFLVSHGADLNRKLHFDEATRTSSTGELTEDAVGSDFTVKKLIGLSLTMSDNMAYRLLFKTYGRYGFNSYVKDTLGLSTPKLPPGYEFSTVTAHDLTYGMLDIYDYSLENDYDWFIELLKTSAPAGLIDGGSAYVTAHKYGFHGGYDGYHDTAIVYAPTPYILTIMTRVFPYDKNSDEVFSTITDLVERIHMTLFE